MEKTVTGATKQQTLKLKWVYTGHMEKGPTVPGQEKQAQRVEH